MELPKCPQRYPLQLLGRKWTYPLLSSLDEPCTFTDIKHKLHTITNHILSEELKFLQSEQLISHEDEHYQRTVAGDALVQAAQQLTKWSEEYRKLPECNETRLCDSCKKLRE